MGHEFDLNTLSWVKSELDETLNQARKALEAYVEDEADETQLQFCVNYMHQIRGTLHMVELYGAALAAEEMEHLTQALVDGKVNNRNDAYEVLMRAILQLPDYLEHLLAGHSDIPMVLLPLLNDLRASRGESLLSENALFTPDLSVSAPLNKDAAGDISEQARKLRHNYHLGLLGWFRDHDSDASLGRIADVIEQLRQTASEEEINRLLWVASGLVESLRQGGLDSNVSIKLLLGQLDRQLKKIIDNGVSALSSEPPLELLKNLLYYVATSQSDGTLTKEIKQAFKLDEVMPDTKTLERARTDLAGPNADLMNTVSTVLMDDLAQVKDSLDVFVRSEAHDVNDMKPLCDKLKQMADTLGMLGMGIQRNVVTEQHSILSAMINGEQEVGDTALMGVAGAMLSLESSLSEASTARAVNDELETADADENKEISALQKLQGVEQQKLIQTVIEETRVDLARVKEAISDFSQNLENREVLEVIPPILGQIKGSVAILNLVQGAELLEKCNDYIKRGLLQGGLTPTNDDLDNLADAISSIEYYLESLAGKWGNPDAILNVAQQSLEKLLQSSADYMAEVPAELVAANEPDLIIPEDLNEGTVEAATPDDLPEIETETQDGGMPFESLSVDSETLEEHLVDLELDGVDDAGLNIENFDDTEVSDETAELSPSSLEGLSLEEFDESPAEGELDAQINADQQDEDIQFESLSVDKDSEEEPLVDLELDEVSDATSNLESLDEAGAPDEAAESSSSLLEGLSIEGFDEISEAESLQDAFTNEEPGATEDESSYDADVISLSDITLDFDSIESPQTLTPEIEDEVLIADIDIPHPETVIPERLSSPAVQPIEDIDDEIIEIFFEEAEEEYENICRLLPEWINNQSDDTPLKEMRRSFHTLKGSGRLVGAADVGEFAWAFENMLNRVIDQTINTGPAIFEILEKAKQALPELFELFKSGLKPGQPILMLMEHAEALSQGKELEIELGTAGEDQVNQDVVEPEQNEEMVFEEPGVALVEEEQQALPIEDIDPILLDIYRKEVETHLSTLRSFINRWHAYEEQNVSDELLRALHTLTGSSRTTDVWQVSELCGLFEELVRDLKQLQMPVNEQTVSALEETVNYIAEVTSILNVPGAVIEENSTLHNTIQTLLEDVRASTPTLEISIKDEGHNISAAEADSVVDLLEQDASAPIPEYDEELLEIFLEEGEEILDANDNTISHWVDDPQDQEAIEALQRQLHTLKGGARMADISEIGDLGHSIESMLTAVVDGHLQVSESMFSLMQRSQDRLVQMLEQVKSHQVLTPATDLIAEVDKLLGRDSPGNETIAPVTGDSEPVTNEAPATLEPESIEIRPPETELVEYETTFSGDEQVATEVMGASATDNVKSQNLVAEVPNPDQIDNVVPLEKETPLPPSSPVAEETEEPEVESDRRRAPRVQQDQVRVRSDLLNNLVNFAGEVSIYRSRMEQQSNSFRFNLQELDETVSRLREQLRQFEIEAETQIQYRQEETLSQSYEDFDPLEFDRFTQMQHLSRAMLESLSDLDSIRGILANLTRESETLLLQQSRVNTELQEGLMRTRMVPFSGIIPRLRRIVRQTGDELGKKVEFNLHGVERELDRTVLDRVIPPIEHMLRNAIAHGIEASEQRIAADKNEVGQINLALQREGSDIVIIVSDDGGGMNLNAIHKKAIERGLITPNTKVTKEMLLNIIMESGFSTAEEVTQIAGRGVGMDVVNNEIKQLGGVFEIDTKEGKGTTFTINLPLTLAITRALMVNVGEETYAIPLLSVQGVERITQEELFDINLLENPVYKWLDEDFQFIHLGSVLGVSKPAALEPGQKALLLLVRSGDFRAAIQVEGLIGSREIVVKSVGPQLSTLRGITGATIMGDGSVVLILDLGVLIRLTIAQDVEDVIEITPQETVTTHTLPTVMVVDDSITVRKVTSRLLERNDYKVMTAKDGVDALAQLQDSIPDIMLLDVEMPRMDGFELATNMRNDERLKDIPIIMITSRTGQKHRDQAMNIGVNIYMGKPYAESNLLENIDSLVKA